MNLNSQGLIKLDCEFPISNGIYKLHKLINIAMVIQTEHEIRLSESAFQLFFYFASINDREFLINNISAQYHIKMSTYVYMRIILMTCYFYAHLDI